MTEEHDGPRALDELYWRAEILQVMYWMKGEGIAEDVTSTSLAAFLVDDSGRVDHHLERLADDGFVERVGASKDGHTQYRLSPSGHAEGSRYFRDEFAELTRPTHGECTQDCSCHDPMHAGEPCPSHPDRFHGA